MNFHIRKIKRIYVFSLTHFGKRRHGHQREIGFFKISFFFLKKCDVKTSSNILLIDLLIVLSNNTKSLNLLTRRGRIIFLVDMKNHLSLKVNAKIDA